MMMAAAAEAKQIDLATASDAIVMRLLETTNYSPEWTEHESYENPVITEEVKLASLTSVQVERCCMAVIGVVVTAKTLWWVVSILLLDHPRRGLLFPLGRRQERIYCAAAEVEAAEAEADDDDDGEEEEDLSFACQEQELDEDSDYEEQEMDEDSDYEEEEGKEDDGEQENEDEKEENDLSIGVSRRKKSNIFRARINFHKKYRHIGCFHSEEAATIALNYAKKAWGKLNTRKRSEKVIDKKVRSIAGKARTVARKRVTGEKKEKQLPRGVSRYRKDKFRARCQFLKKDRHVGYFHSEEAATIAVNYAEKAWGKLNTLDLSEKVIDNEVRSIAGEAREYATQCVHEQPTRIATRKRSSRTSTMTTTTPVTTTLEDTSTRSKRHKNK